VRRRRPIQRLNRHSGDTCRGITPTIKVAVRPRSITAADPAFRATGRQREKIRAMNLSELRDRLEQVGVPDDLYSLDGGLWGDRICIEKRGTSWLVYHSERGQRFDEATFGSESEACDRLYELLTAGRMSRYQSQPGRAAGDDA